jgi:hypothetical protein
LYVACAVPCAIMKIVSFIIFVFALCASFLFKGKEYPPAYWLWAGITADDAPANAEFYVYQGLITTDKSGSSYQRIGLYPHPLKNQKLYLVYRFKGQLPDPAFIMKIFLNGARQWQRHHLKVSGLQLDFDSPTAKLAMYGDFLKNVHQQLPKQFALSITGLGDWVIHGNKALQKSIASATNEVVFQLYQDRNPLPNRQYYINALKDYPFPFRVGLLANFPDKKEIAFLSRNVRFCGPIYFIQKN